MLIVIMSATLTLTVFIIFYCTLMSFSVYFSTYIFFSLEAIPALVRKATAEVTNTVVRKMNENLKKTYEHILANEYMFKRKKFYF